MGKDLLNEFVNRGWLDRSVTEGFDPYWEPAWFAEDDWRAATRRRPSRGFRWKAVGCMAIDISRAVDAVGEERFAELSSSAPSYWSAGVIGRAAVARSLGALADELREADATLSGAKTPDLDAAIVSRATGSPVSERSVERDEACARAICGGLAACWCGDADSGTLPRTGVLKLATLPKGVQSRLRRMAEDGGLCARATSALIGRACGAVMGTGACDVLRAVEAIEDAAASGRPQPDWLVRRARAAADALESADEEKG